MSHRYVEDRLLSWATSDHLHQPGWPEDTIEYRVMTGQTASGGKGAHGDGGMTRAATRYRHDLVECERAREVHHALAELKQFDETAHKTVVLAFTDRPGYRLPPSVGAQRVGISEKTWKTRYRTGLSFIGGVLNRQF